MPAARRQPLARLAAEPAELLVIGGGIVGAGIARDAAMRGVRTVLVERHDLGFGSSSRSSRLVHGGLRYLEQGAFRLVAEANRERAVLLRIAPHLVRPLPFVFPVHTGDRVGRLRLAAGLWLYDMLALFRNVGRHQWLSRERLLDAEPVVRDRGLQGGARYYDAQCDDARLVVATARSALAHGASIATYSSVHGLLREGGRIMGAEVEDRLSGARVTVRAEAVINATGPWSDGLRRLEESAATPLLRTTKGVHVVVLRSRLGHHEAITFTSPIDGRVMFLLPWGDLSYIGTTDTDSTEHPEAVRADGADVLYLLRSANAQFPGAHLTEDDVRATWAGLRPLLAGAGASSASAVSREHAIVEGAGGMLTVAGGKLTTYRSMAAEAVDRAVPKLARRRLLRPEAGTDRESLPGGETADLEPFRAQGLDAGFSAATVEHLLRHYGTEAAGLYNLARSNRALAMPLTPGHPAIAAEVVHAARRELAQRVDDVLVRRIHLFYETPDQGRDAARKTAALLAAQLGWSAERTADEVRRYDALVAGGGALPTTEPTGATTAR